MQWLINIIKEWVNAQGFLTTSFVDRGCEGTPDYTQADLTLDGFPHDLDFSTVVPAGAKAVLFQWTVLDNGVSSYLTMWMKENAGCENSISIFTQVASIYYVVDLVTPIGPSRILTYHGIPVDFLEIYIVAKGWWL